MTYSPTFIRQGAAGFFFLYSQLSLKAIGGIIEQLLIRKEVASGSMATVRRAMVERVEVAWAS